MTTESRYTVAVKPKIGKMLSKFKKNDRHVYEIIMKKVNEILINPNRYKNLNYPLNKLKRVHIDSHFVLLFSVDEETKTVSLEDFEHHDDAY